MSDAPRRLPDDYADALAIVGAATLNAAGALEAAFRRLHPPAIPALRAQLGPVRDRLEEALDAYRAAEVPEDLLPLHEQLAAGAGAGLEALAGILDPAPPERRIANVLGAMRRSSQALEILYPLRLALPPLGRLFAEAAWHDRLAELDPEPPEGVTVGLHRAGPDDAEDARGGFFLYVPERHRGDAPRPLIVALHGGSGNGRDFLWTWLREARSRDCLLLSPTSRGGTWALDSPAGEARALASMIDYVREGWRVDPERILLTGLSDGATFTLLAGLLEDSPYTALAPISGVLHPANFALGNLERARGRRIYLVHGALDWMFPVGIARMAAEELRKAGADLVYRDIEDLSHTYPREENALILDWLG